MAVSMEGRVLMDEKVESRRKDVRRIAESIARDEYRVDPQAVAEAIVRQLLERRGQAAEPR